MAQVLHMDPSFSGTSNPAPSLGKADMPYSVETPYGYRLDLDFLKYVNDIEKGNTIKRVPIQRRPRYGSLPRGGYGYTGSWWTSTESLCSNVSMDSRHSSYSFCAPGYQASRTSGAGGAFSLSAARVEKTLLDARRRLEEEKAGRRLSGLGSVRSSVAGSTTSLSGSSHTQGGGQYTPASSGLSTPVSPTPAHLQHVREQMALALRKIRELEEQVKTIPVLQVKISVLQEEKRQLSVQLKSQKFLGHTLGFGRSRAQGELYIHIPEEEAPPPVAPDASRQASADDALLAGRARPGRREVRSVGVGTEERPEQGSLALRSRVGQLEEQLRRTQQELQEAQRERASRPPPQADYALRATSLGWPGGGVAATAGLQTVVSVTQQPRRREQRTVGIQVYTLEQPTLVRAERWSGAQTSRTPPTQAGHTPSVQTEHTPPAQTGHTVPIPKEHAPPVESEQAPPMKTGPTPLIETVPTLPIMTSPTPPTEKSTTPPIETAPTLPIVTSSTPPIDTSPTQPIEIVPILPLVASPNPPTESVSSPPIETSTIPPRETGPTPSIETGPTPPIETAPLPPIDTEHVLSVETGSTPTIDIGNTPPKEPDHTLSTQPDHVSVIETEHALPVETGLTKLTKTDHITSIETCYVLHIVGEPAPPTVIGLTPLTETDHTPSIETVQSSSIETVQSSSVETVQSTSVETVQSSSIETVQSSSIETVQSSPIETVQSSLIETVQASLIETDQASPIETVQAPPIETVQSSPIETVQASPIETVQAPAIETVQAPPIETVQAPPIETVQAPPMETVQSSPIETVLAPPIEREPIPPTETTFPVHPHSLECMGHETHHREDTPPQLPIAVCSKEIREVLLKSEVSTSMPVSRATIAVETICNQMIPLSERLKEGEGALQQTDIEADQSQEEASKSASTQAAPRSIMKKKSASPSTKKNLQFIGVNGGYESTSSEDSSSESSEEESDASEYHEATEGIPRPSAQHPHEGSSAPPASVPPTERTTETCTSAQSPSIDSASQQGTSQSPSTESAPQQGTGQSPSIDSASQQGGSQSSCLEPVHQQECSQSPSAEPAPEQGTSQLPSIEATPQQSSSQSPSTAPQPSTTKLLSIDSTLQEHSIQSSTKDAASELTATQSPVTDPASQLSTAQSHAIDHVSQSCVTQSLSIDPASQPCVTQSPASDSVTQSSTTQSLGAESAPQPTTDPTSQPSPAQEPPTEPACQSSTAQPSTVPAAQQATQEEGLGGPSSAHSVSQETRLELSGSLTVALAVLQKALSEPNGFGQPEARAAYTTVLQEWLRVSCHKTADTGVVKAYMDAFASVSPQLLEFIVNMADGNGNTALHYTVSHSNFPVVKLLLDTGVCNTDKQNKAGYTAIMLTALAAFHSDSDLHTVVQLLRTGDVNAKASQAGQTALMLAVSHGRADMVRALISCGAKVNIQDDDGSTALMCACEHGHVDIVRQLLSVPGCDATLADNDGSTALSIALEASQNDIAVLLYAHLNFAKPPSPVSPKSPQLSSPSEAK
ncbi:KN motif and ankyrin repeat domain-containing protein 2 isoform X1 [Conger conger]|uniref:KN motif and ankyrin repeat domain-containing protein 2 isoform X1 n=1 Tax=Conger conger TaxID=82655 RepID=UPI002A59D045|nr:KN motif and ankyrin repeat domain-containing protein 2 isoform X1 [Conger conger]XP_061081039.1 KN motif and ankyrin repeat domain-containing protein 2 isoform X1 [Conger conger]